MASEHAPSSLPSPPTTEPTDNVLVVKRTKLLMGYRPASRIVADAAYYHHRYQQSKIDLEAARNDTAKNVAFFEQFPAIKDRYQSTEKAKEKLYIGLKKQANDSAQILNSFLMKLAEGNLAHRHIGDELTEAGNAAAEARSAAFSAKEVAIEARNAVGDTWATIAEARNKATEALDYSKDVAIKSTENVDARLKAMLFDLDKRLGPVLDERISAVVAARVPPKTDVKLEKLWNDLNFLMSEFKIYKHETDKKLSESLEDKAQLKTYNALLDARLTKLQEDNASMGAELSLCKKTVASMTNSNKYLQKHVQKLQDDHSSIRKVVDETDKSVVETRNSVEGLHDAINNIEKSQKLSLINLRPEAKENNPSAAPAVSTWLPDNFKTDWEAMKEYMQIIHDKQGGLEERLEKTNTAMAEAHEAVTEEFEQVTTVLGETEARLEAGIETKVTAHVEAKLASHVEAMQTSWNAQLTELTVRTSKLETTMIKSENKLQNLDPLVPRTNKIQNVINRISLEMQKINERLQLVEQVDLHQTQIRAQVNQQLALLEQKCSQEIATVKDFHQSNTLAIQNLEEILGTFQFKEIFEKVIASVQNLPVFIKYPEIMKDLQLLKSTSENLSRWRDGINAGLVTMRADQGRLQAAQQQQAQRVAQAAQSIQQVVMQQAQQQQQQQQAQLSLSLPPTPVTAIGEQQQQQQQQRQQQPTNGLGSPLATSATSASVAAINTQLDKFASQTSIDRAELNALTTRFAVLETSLKDLEAEQVLTKQKLQSLTDLNELTAEIAKLAERLNLQSTRLADQETGSEKVKETINALDNEVKEMDNTLRVLRGDFTQKVDRNLSDWAKRVQERMAKLGGKLKEMDERVLALEGGVVEEEGGEEEQGGDQDGDTKMGGEGDLSGGSAEEEGLAGKAGRGGAVQVAGQRAAQVVQAEGGDRWRAVGTGVRGAEGGA